VDSSRILLTNVQRFSLHDGPGIRTTVFLKGCSLHCPWCANPENIHMYQEEYQKDGQTGTYGRYVSADQLFLELLKDKPFFGTEGGVTFSGGEPLLQMDVLESVMIKLQEAQIHMCMETCLFAPSKALKKAMHYINLFYVDCKILTGDACKLILGGNISLYQRNIEQLSSSNIPMIFRLPIIGGYTDTHENMQLVLEMIQQYRPASVELLREHSLGSNKYASLGMEPPKLMGVEDALIEEYCRNIQHLGIPAKICRI